MPSVTGLAPDNTASTPQHREELRRVAELRTQLPGPGVGAFHLGAAFPLVARNAVPSATCKVQLLHLGRSGVSSSVVSTARPCVRCAIASTGAELESVLAGLLPVRNSPVRSAPPRCSDAPALRVGSQRCRKTVAQHLCNALMVLLPRALEQGLIGGILDQGMLEDIGCACGGSPR